MSIAQPAEYAYLKVPPAPQMRPCAGLVLAGMAMRARVGVGGLDEAVDILERFHSQSAPTRYRFSLGERRVIAEVEETAEATGQTSWRTVVELVS